MVRNSVFLTTQKEVRCTYSLISDHCFIYSVENTYFGDLTGKLDATNIK